jgi:large subunit ribosomal protein L7/L12
MSGTSIAIVVVVAIVLVVLLRAGPGSASPRIDWSNATEGDVQRLLAAGRKIEAIKLYRELNGVGLKEAKDAVERLAAGQPPSGGG